MPQFINTNVASLNSQRALNTSQNSLQTSLQRLSSGLRINSAKDDAAGLAISERMTGQIRGMNQAIRNANDGISLAQTAEGAMAESTNILQRVRELSVQSSNATNSTSDRAALDSEVQQLLSELDRIATTAEFNGTKLLDGSFTSQQFQVGANSNQTISVSVTGVRSNQIGAVVNQAGNTATAVTITPTETGTVANVGQQASVATYTGVSANPIDAGLNSLIINATTVANSAASIGDTHATDPNKGEDQSSAYAKTGAINASNIDGVNATADNTQTFAAITEGFLDNNTVDDDTLTYTLTLNNQAVFTVANTASSGDVAIADVVSAVNQFTATTGVSASADSNGALVLQNASGGNIDVAEAFSVTDGTGGTALSTANTVFSTYTEGTDGDDAAGSSYLFRGQVTLQSNSAVQFSGGNQDDIGFSTATPLISASGSLLTTSVDSVENANSAILAVDSALNSINSARADLGAIQSRFDSTISNLSGTAENLSAARSRIRDADFASETAELTRNQILQQAGIAMLSQANPAPQNVLALLQ